jgi:hypothetical protein
MDPVVATVTKIPGGTRAAAWALVMHAAVLRRLGNLEGARAVADDAGRLFTALGIADGVGFVERLSRGESRLSGC